MSGYWIISLIIFAFLAGIGTGWNGHTWYDGYKEAAQLAQQIADSRKVQTNIDSVATVAEKTVAAEDQQTLAIIETRPHEKKLTDCQLDPATVQLLRKASKPATKLP